MSSSPGFLLPSAFPSKNALVTKLHEIDQEAGYTKLDENSIENETSDSIAQGLIFKSDSLAHHGIKGMKWGNRKGSSSTSSKPGPSEDHLSAEAHKQKARAGGVKALSNEELQKLNTRMQLEQNHRNLVGQKPSTFDRGHGHVKKVLSAGKTLADVYNTVNSPAGKAARKALGG